MRNAAKVMPVLIGLLVFIGLVVLGGWLDTSGIPSNLWP